MMNGVHSARCIQIGGENFISTKAASATTIKPRNKMTKTAGPSPASCPERSRPQTSHAPRTFRRPVNNLPWPHRGQRQPSTPRIGEIAGTSFIPPRRRRRWPRHTNTRHCKGTTTPRRPSAAGREQARRENRPEERCEKHHLGGDEQRHPVAHPELYDGGVIALKGRLANDVAPPHRHGRQHREGADDQEGPAIAVHVEDA